MLGGRKVSASMHNRELGYMAVCMSDTLHEKIEYREGYVG